MFPSKQSTLLPNLSWHDDRPFEEIVRKEIPESSYRFKVEDYLMHLWVDEQYDFHLYRKQQTDDTLYDYTIMDWTSELTKAKEEFKKEELLFEKLAKKFEEQGAPSEEVVDEKSNASSGEEEVSNDIAPDTKVKGKVAKECKRSLKKKQAHEAMLAKSIKSSMASSQQKLMDLQKEMDDLETKIAVYENYKQISLEKSRTLHALVRQYSSTQDRVALIRGLETMVSQEDKQLRSRISKEKCSGDLEGLCEKHYLPLSCARYSATGLVQEMKCRLAPL